MAGKLDVHTHALPDFFHKPLIALGRDATGVPMIEWSMEDTKKMNAKLNIGVSILSLSAPGPDVLPDKEGARSVARQYNEWAASITKANSTHFGFFAAVPSLHDYEGSLAEIRYALDVLKADGVCLFTSYDSQYLGTRAFEPVWKELNDRAAVVFIHPTMAKDSHLVSTMLQPPSFDFAHETGRTAAHLILTGMKRKYADTKIILSHGGGTLPILSERLAISESHRFLNTLDQEGGPKTYEAILEDTKSFYFDLALAGTPNVLDMLLKWAPPGHVLYGSDYPYADAEAVFNTEKLAEYDMPDGVREDYYVGNGLALFPRFKKS